MKQPGLSWVLLLTLAAFSNSANTAPSELHKDVQAALDYELPVNECRKPNLIAQSSNVVDGQGAREQTDVDSYTIERYERKESRWKVCLEEYREVLMEDFEALKASARHGLTQEQADVILGKMKFIQTVYFSPEGRIENP